MKIKIIISIVALILGYACFSYILVGFQSQAREAFEEGKFCDSYRMLRWTSLLSKEGKYLMAAMYARGLCPEQDISQAKDLYVSIYGDYPSELGKAFFYDAIETAESAGRSEIELKPATIQALLVESKKLGFSPQPSELSKLDEMKIRSYYDGEN